MKRWIAGLCLVVNFAAACSQTAYDRTDKMQQFNKGWDEAIAKSWTVVSMKNDWKTIYPPVKEAGGSKN